MADDGKFRFFVADEADRPRSSQWFIYEHRGSVYASASLLGGLFKLSLHPCGSGQDGCDSQIGLTRNYAQREEASGFSVFPPIRWARPLTPQIGTVLVASIAFPTDFLKGEVLLSGKSRRRYSFKIAPAGQAFVISIFYSSEDPTALEERFIATGADPLIWMKLPSAEYASIVAKYAPFDPKFVPVAKPGSPHKLSGAPKTGETIEDAHAILFSEKPSNGAPIYLAEVNGLAVSN